MGAMLEPGCPEEGWCKAQPLPCEHMEGVSIKNLERPPSGEKQGEQSLRDLVEDFVWTTCECCVVTSSDCTSLILSSHLRPTRGMTQMTYRMRVLGS